MICEEPFVRRITALTRDIHFNHRLLPPPVVELKHSEEALLLVPVLTITRQLENHIIGTELSPRHDSHSSLIEVGAHPGVKAAHELSFLTIYPKVDRHCLNGKNHRISLCNPSIGRFCEQRWVDTQARDIALNMISDAPPRILRDNYTSFQVTMYPVSG